MGRISDYCRKLNLVYFFLLQTLLILALIFGISEWSPETGETQVIRLHGRGFSFQVGQPADWTLDTRSAPQLANFILYPVGTDWRRARTVIFARFASVTDEQTVEEFLQSDRREFLEECPFADSVSKPETRSEIPRFKFQRFRCPGVRDELLALTRVPGFIVTFVLSTQKTDGIDKTTDEFMEVLRYFDWESVSDSDSR